MRPALLFFLFLGAAGCGTAGLPTRAYPPWFLSQGEAAPGCEVGYAQSSPYPDSSAARAFMDACHTGARHALTEVRTAQAFVSSEDRTAFMGGVYREHYDTVGAFRLMARLAGLDTFRTRDMTLVLAGKPGNMAGPSGRPPIPPSREPPGWTMTLPSEPDQVYAVGVAPEYFYESSSWREAEAMARRNLARSLVLRTEALLKQTRESTQEVRHETQAVVLQDVQVMARWRNEGIGIYYVLSRMKQVRTKNDE
ncbi:MAG: hypothetical protein WB626_08520 [Bacteroidota bacterium]